MATAWFVATVAASAAQPPGAGPVLRAPWAATDALAAPVSMASKADSAELSRPVEARIRLAQQANAADQQNVNAPAAATSDLEVELLKQLKTIVDRQKTAKERTAQLEAEAEQAENDIEQLKRGAGLEENPPYSFLLMESVDDAVTTQTARVETLKQTNEEAIAAVERAMESLKRRSRDVQSAKEDLDNNKDPQQREMLAAALKEAELKKEIAAAEVELHKTQRENERLELAVQRRQLEYLNEKLAIVEAGATFSEQDLKDRLLELDTQANALTREQETAEQEKRRLERRWSEAKDKADASGGSDEALNALVDARDKALRAANEAKDLVSKRSSWVTEAREFWRHRYDVATGQYERSDLDKWRAAATGFLEEIEAERVRVDGLLKGIRKTLADVQRQLQSADAQDGVNSEALREQQNTLRNRAETIGEHIVFIEAQQRLGEKLVDEIDERRLTFDPREWASWLWVQAKWLWDYPLVDVEPRPIKVSTVLRCLLLLVLGIWASRRISHIIGSRLLPRLGVHEGAAAALQSLTFYALVMTSALMALSMVQVPLTVFTFLGGAAAIGLGFGSQNILNNFISGLIMLVEQPIRVGDLVEISELAGIVESIGMRSTRIRTSSNQEMIVPNSTFLENNVMNWTLSDSTVRCVVAVGVAYGSPTREVARWLKQAAEKHGMVIKKPEPFVWFTGFGDNSLNFELHFFIVIRTLAERRRIESDLRFMIDQLLRDANITIAFPQRDIHLDTLQPLEVRMVPTVEQAGLEESPPAIGSPDSPATKPADVNDPR